MKSNHSIQTASYKELYFCDKANLVQLILEITDARFSAFESQSDSIRLISEVLCSNKTEHGYKEQLTQLIASLGVLDRFESFSCSYSNAQFSLVPQLLFAESTPEQLLQFTVQNPIPKGETDYNRLPEWNMVNVFHLPQWIKSVLVMRIPRIVIQHEITHIVRHLNTGSTIPQRAHMILQDSTFTLVIRLGGQIVHASIQEYQAAEDVVYHLSMCMQQLKIDQKLELNFHASTTPLRVKGEEILQLCRKIQLFEQHTMKLSEYQHLNFQALCV